MEQDSAIKWNELLSHAPNTDESEMHDAKWKKSHIQKSYILYVSISIAFQQRPDSEDIRQQWEPQAGVEERVQWAHRSRGTWSGDMGVFHLRRTRGYPTACVLLKITAVHSEGGSILLDVTYPPINLIQNFFSKKGSWEALSVGQTAWRTQHSTSLWLTGNTFQEGAPLSWRRPFKVSAGKPWTLKSYTGVPPHGTSAIPNSLSVLSLLCLNNWAPLHLQPWLSGSPGPKDSSPALFFSRRTTPGLPPIRSSAPFLQLLFMFPGPAQLGPSDHLSPQKSTNCFSSVCSSFGSC